MILIRDLLKRRFCFYYVSLPKSAPGSDGFDVVRNNWIKQRSSTYTKFWHSGLFWGLNGIKISVKIHKYFICKNDLLTGAVLTASARHVYFDEFFFCLCWARLLCFSLSAFEKSRQQESWASCWDLEQTRAGKFSFQVSAWRGRSLSLFWNKNVL